MAENTKDELLEPENTSDEIIPIRGNESINTKQKIETMEVHHHAHPEGKKNWKSYFWEFLMLFLAVFCGFLAEYQLEHVIEHQREKDYIKSFVQDVKNDTAELKQIIAKIDSIILFRDSLLTELGNPSVIGNSKKAFYFTSKSYHFPDFIYSDRTIQQLKNSGSMRLIRNKQVSDNIMDYDSKVRILFVHQQQLNVFALNLITPIDKMFQKRLLESTVTATINQPVPLLTSSKAEVEEFYNYMMDQKDGFLLLKTVETDLFERGTNLIKFIQKEYHLENE